MPEARARALLRRAALLALLAWLAVLLPLRVLAQAQQDSTRADLPERILLATMAPGSEFWSVFGHNALILEYPDRAAESYNFGYFDFAEPGFLRRFAFGAMEYLAVRLPAAQDLGRYRDDGRAVWLQELDLDPAQRAALAERLRQHVRPEHARYRYDYFRNNCSTKVRDLIDAATGGAVRAASVRRSHGYTYRGLALAQSGGVPWMYLAMHAGLGRPADGPLSVWDESYLPALLSAALRRVELVAADGSRRPLVRSERPWGEIRELPPARVALPLAWPWCLASGLVLGLLLWRAPAGRALSALGFGLALLLGLGGLACVFFWGFTAHWAAALNHNLVLLNPLYLLLAALWLRPNAAVRWAVLLFGIGLFGSFLKVLPAFYQQNLEWLLLVLPVQAGLWLLARRRVARPAWISATS